MIRFRSLSLINFKNVNSGTIRLSNAMSLDDIGLGADVVGIYGQNGSGKTSFIQALYILKLLMLGEKLPYSVRELISSGADDLRITAELLLVTGDDEQVADYLNGILADPPLANSYLVEYAVRIGRRSGHSPLLLSESLKFKDLDQKGSFREILAWAVTDGASAACSTGSSALSFSTVVPSWVGNPEGSWEYDLGSLAPLTHWRAVNAIDKVSSRIEVARQRAFEEGRSLVFSQDFQRAAMSIPRLDEEFMSKATLDAVMRVLVPTMTVSTYGRQFALKNMAVLPTSHQGTLALNYLPLAMHGGKNADYTDNFMLLDIDQVSSFTTGQVNELEQALESLNGVIAAVVPGLQIEVARLGLRAGEAGEALEQVELMARRGESRTPFRNESEGIKKILSIVSLLVDVHANPLTFLAVDELDSGVFEYLLGELLSAIAEHGMGQLVFTAHNLRPLEVLDSDSIWFTTTDEKDRYVVSRGVRGSNNLRRMYLRRIQLGGGDADVYVPTSPREIDSALYDAGMAIRGMRTAEDVGGNRA